MEDNLSLVTIDESPNVVLQSNPIDSTTAALFSALSSSTTLSMPSTSFVNKDLFFEAYLSFHPESFEFPLAFSALPPQLLDVDGNLHGLTVLLSTVSGSSFPFNSVLYSGCTNYIVHDCSLFWMYNPALATPVKTANCGFLQTLAHGTVCFCVTSGTHSVIFILKDSLYVPDAPLNLLLVGLLVEKGIDVTFVKNCMTIALLSAHPVLPGFSFEAIVLHHLSFLNYDFVLPSIPPSASLPVLSLSLLDLGDQALAVVFPHVSLTPELWHRCLGHSGLEATCAILTKDYATGIEHNGSFKHSHCIFCLIEKSP
jgi:hypothetical protein